MDKESLLLEFQNPDVIRIELPGNVSVDDCLIYLQYVDHEVRHISESDTIVSGTLTVVSQYYPETLRFIKEDNHLIVEARSPSVSSIGALMLLLYRYNDSALHVLTDAVKYRRPFHIAYTSEDLTANLVSEIINMWDLWGYYQSDGHIIACNWQGDTCHVQTKLNTNEIILSLNSTIVEYGISLLLLLLGLHSVSKSTSVIIEQSLNDKFLITALNYTKNQLLHLNKHEGVI